MGKVIFNTRDLSTASDEILNKVDKAVLAAAFRVRDKARAVFISRGSDYRHHNATRYNPLAEGIMVGKLQSGTHTTVVHALGANATGSNLWKTRFFVGGTKERMTPHRKGLIEKNDSVYKGAEGGQQILDQYIENAIQ